MYPCPVFWGHHNCLTNRSKLIEKNTAFCFDLLILLLSDNSLSQDDKVAILANSLKSFNPEQTKSSLEAIGMDQLAGVFEGRKPKINREPFTEKILKALKEYSWVSSYNLEKNDGQEYYQVFPKKVKY